MQSKLIIFVQKFLFVIPLLLILKIFLPWFINPSINAGDWAYYGKGMFDGFSIFAPLWTAQGGIGLGGVNPNLPLFGYLYFTIGLFVNTLHIPWEVAYKIFWFGLPLVLGIIAIVYLYKTIKQSFSLWEVSLSSFLYLCNTYFLMIVGGGQMGVAIAYTCAPFVVASVVGGIPKLINIKPVFRLKNGVIFGIFLALQVFFDSRLAFLTMGVCLLYIIYYYFFIKHISLIGLFEYLGIGLFTTFLLHSYWIVPFYLFKLLYLPVGLTSTGGFSFFSFADFSHAFAYVHPNWPENIFGKVYFLQPAFLVFPLLAFSGLLIIKKNNDGIKKYFLFFSFIALLGVFMGKGINDPFGFINFWLFNHIPGFNLFRDPTKWYLLIAISYSIMIPMTLKELVGALYKKQVIQTLVILIVTILLLFPIREAIVGELKGTFVNTQVPTEYVQLGNFLSSQQQFFRTLWIPDQSRFRFISETHPMLIASDIFHSSSTSTFIKQLNNLHEEQYLEDLSIKYLIVPDDTTGEIFLTNRKYDDKKRQTLIQDLDTIEYLKKIIIGRTVLYELPNPQGHFYFQDGQSVSYVQKSSSDYILSLDINKPETLIFSESYHPGWQALVNGKTIKSIKTKDGLNSFDIPSGTYSLKIIFVPEIYQSYFYLFSGVCLGGILLFLLFLTRKC